VPVLTVVDAFQSIHLAVTHSTSSIVRKGRDRKGEPSRIASFLKCPIEDSARALSLGDAESRRHRHRHARGRQVRVLIEVVQHQPNRSLLRLPWNPR
jgi:hypothetical protein